MMLPALIAGGVYLARSPAASISAHTTDRATAQQPAGTCGAAAGGSPAGASGSSSAGASAGAPCAESPAYISTASPEYINTATGPNTATGSNTATGPQAPATPARSSRPTPRPSLSAPTSTSTSPASPGSSRPASHTPTPAPTSPTHTAPTRKASASASPSAQPSASASQASTAAAAVLALINRARSAAGLTALTLTTGLETSSSAHNSVMAAGCGLSHQCPGEAALGARETTAGVRWTAAGENIGDGGPVANTTAAITQMVVTLTQDMLNEQPPNDGHRLNILSTSFTHIGIAVVRGNSGTVWLTQDFSN